MDAETQAEKKPGETSSAGFFRVAPEDATVRQP
jgi:hypothetical protein